MININCDCGQRAYIDYMFEDDNGDIIQSVDIDTMGIEFGEDGLSFKCSNCKKTFHIVRVS